MATQQWNNTAKKYETLPSENHGDGVHKYSMGAHCLHCAEYYSFHWNTIDEIKNYASNGWPCPHCGGDQRCNAAN